MPRPRVPRRLALASVALVLLAAAAGTVTTLISSRSDTDDRHVVVRMDEADPGSGAGWQHLDLGPDASGWIPETVLETSRRPPGALDDPSGWRYPLRAEPRDDAPVTGYFRVGG